VPVKRFDKTPMPVQQADERAHNFREVNEGYTEAHARFEAERCLRCQDPICVSGCPVGVPIPQFIHAVAMGDMLGASKLLRSANPLAAICGRVCAQEHQCEARCSLAGRFNPVAIGHLERFVADWERTRQPDVKPAITRHERIAIVGSGPAGLVCAGELARLGYSVTIYEALHAPGGVLRYGIPEFRLPKDILDWEIGLLADLGVDIQCNVIIGRTLSLDQLTNKLGYAAVFIGTGAGLPQFLGIPGENLTGVYSANEFLTRINLMRGYSPDADTPVAVGKRVAVIGAGNTAMDAVRTAVRMGATEAMVVYRRSEAEMSARAEEHHHAREEGVRFHWLTNPIEVLDDGAGNTAGLLCQRMELGEPDASGRRRPVPIPESEFVLQVDNVVLAIGTTPNPMLTRTTAGLATSESGCIVADERTGLTSRTLVFAGGDAVSGAATVILAAGAGKRAAAAIHQALTPVEPPVRPEAVLSPASRDRVATYVPDD
jgi:glutamate synthase (NADPH) small chain